MKMESISRHCKDKAKKPFKSFTRYKTNFKIIVNRFLIRLSERLRLAYALGLPYSITIEPTNRCNLNCPLCLVGTGRLRRPRGNLSFEQFKQIIDEFGGVLESLLLTNYGEPLINKDIFKMIAYAREKGIFVQINTNSYFLDKEKVDQIIESDLSSIIIALDGASEETYLKYRKSGNFKRVIESIKLLVNEKKKRGSGNLFIQIQFVVMKHNEHEILKIKKMATEIGVDKLLFKSVGVQTAEEAREFLPDNPEYRRYELEGDSLIWKSSQNLATNECASLWESTVINWDGSVTPCCYDFNGEYTLGNVFSDGGFRRVWNNGRYRDFRARILSKRRSIPLCAICPGSPGDGEYFLEIEIIN